MNQLRIYYKENICVGYTKILDKNDIFMKENIIYDGFFDVTPPAGEHVVNTATIDIANKSIDFIKLSPSENNIPLKTLLKNQDFTEDLTLADSNVNLEEIEKKLEESKGMFKTPQDVINTFSEMLNKKLNTVSIE